jgi:hypothetical protein
MKGHSSLKRSSVTKSTPHIAPKKTSSPPPDKEDSAKDRFVWTDSDTGKTFPAHSTLVSTQNDREIQQIKQKKAKQPRNKKRSQ